MEGLNKKINDRLPPVHPGTRAWKIVPPVTLAPSSYQVWNTNKPKFKSDGVAAAGIETPKRTSDGSSVGHDGNSQNSSPPRPNKGQAIPGPGAPAIPGAEAIPVAALADDNPVNQVRSGGNRDTMSDHKRFKRLIANRASAQRCRLKKLTQLIDLEKKVRDLEDQVAYLSAQVAIQRSHQQSLQMENIRLKQELFAHKSSKPLKEAKFEQNKAEAIRLRKVQAEIEQIKAEEIRLWKLHLSQQQEKIPGMMPVWEERFEPIVNLSQLNPSGMGQMGLKQEPIGKAPTPLEMEQLNQLDIEGLEQQMGAFGDWNPGLHNQMVSSSLFQSGPSMMPEPVDAKPNLGNIGEQILNFDFKYSN